VPADMTALKVFHTLGGFVLAQLQRISFFSSLHLPLVVAASFALQLALHHVGFLSTLLKTVTPSREGRRTLLAVGFIPLIALELAKVLRSKPVED